MNLYDKQKKYKETKDNIKSLLLNIISNSNITAEQKENINTLNTEYTANKNAVEIDIDKIKENVEVDKDLYIQSKIEELKSIIEKSSDRIQISISGTENNKDQISKIDIELGKISSRVGDAEESVNGTVQKVEPWFYLSTSRTSLENGNWSNVPPTATEGKYLWTRNKTYYVDVNKEPTFSQAVCIAGNTGATGQQGLQGIQGEKGEQGVPGTNGTNGKTSYFHIKYSSVANPTTASQMTETPNTYIGTYVDFIEADSSDPTKYTWARFEGVQGEKGEQGIPGTNGVNGKTSYLHIKYSNDGGNTFTANNGETVGDYIGTCTDFNSADPTTVTAYTWAKIKGERGQQGLQGIQGEKGEQGVPGTNGTNGKTSYFHIKYSSVANPTTASQMTETPNTYIGTYVDFIEADSSDPTKYTWARFEGVQGEKGEQGIPGTNGVNGKTSYLHIKYSNDGGKTFTSNNGETPGDYIGQYTDFTQADSTSTSSYAWSNIKGATGPQGVSVTEVNIEYAKNQSTTTAPTSGWSTTMPSYAKGYYLWMRTRIKYSNSSNYVYSTPTCDEAWKVVAQTYSEYEQLKNQFSWLVKSGTSESNMVLTDKLYKLITDYVLIKAALIELNGKVNITGSSGKVLIEDGNISLHNVGSTYVGSINGNGINFMKVLNSFSNPMYSMDIENGNFSLRNFNTISFNNMKYGGDDWENLVLSSGVAENYSYPSRVREIAGQTEIQLSIKGITTFPKTICNLPTKYRPSRSLFFLGTYGETNPVTVKFKVTSDGDVIATGSTNTSPSATIGYFLNVTFSRA